MGVLRRRGDSWEVDYRVNGRRIKKIVGKDRRIAELYLKDIEVRIAKNDLGFLQKDTDLPKLFAEFLSYSKSNHSPGTQKRYRAIIDNFKRFLGRYPYITKISQLNPKIFEDFKKFRLDEEAENETFNIELQTLRTMFNLAKTWGYTKDNPTDNVKRLKRTNHVTARFLSQEECKKLLEACNEWEYPIFSAFLNTGMRKGELQNLGWKDVNFDRKKIQVTVKDDWTPKTDEREIPINDSLLAILKKQQKTYPDSSFVFQDENGRQIENNKLRKRLMKLTKQCGFPDVTKLHSLRHTFASHLVMNGIDIPTVMKLMGHADIQTTMIYAHLADKHVDKAVEVLSF